MARIRTLKPEFWQSEKLARCTPHARLLAIALLQLADSEGRMRWIPMQVHAHAFPFEEEISLDDLATELETAEYLVRYEVDGRRYACIPKFNEHQRLSGKEAAVKSKFPPPCSTGNKSEANGKEQGKPECFPEKHLDAQEQGTGNREQGVARDAPTRGKSCFVPEDWKPNPIRQRQVQVADGVDIPWELEQFRLHEFAQPKSDWDAAWCAWLRRARPNARGSPRESTTSYAESKHPALVAERQRRNETMKFGSDL